MKHASIRARLIVSYFTSVVLAVTLAPLAYHGLAGRLGLAVPPSLPLSLGLTMLVAAVVSLLYGYVAGYDTIHMIETLTEGARRVAAGDLETPIPVRGQDELTQLAVTFNDMVARLRASLAHEKKLEQARRDLVANVAHDLRTPLAAVRASVEALEEGVAADEATRARTLAAISRETRHLGRLIDDLFALSQLEAGQLDLKPEAVYLEDLAQDCLAGLLPQAEREGIALAVDIPTTLPAVWANRQATRRVLSNLLQNALAFTPAGGRIALRGTPLSGGVQVEVSDTGPGIPPTDLEAGPDGLPRIFERFYRADTARSGGGAGLGLAIARELVHAQGGRIWVESVADKGTTFGFSLLVGEADVSHGDAGAPRAEK